MTTQLITKTSGALRIIQLDRPKALNALGLSLLTELREALQEAFDDSAIRSVWLESTSDKAFCAGGDVKALALEIDKLDAPEDKAEIGRKYFELEYGIDLLIEQSPKPIVTYANGITFGGGWGLFAGGNLRLCSETASFSMPENQIGFYPDVGAAAFLQRNDWKAGTFVGLSGIVLTAKEMLALDYVDDIVPPDYAEVLKSQLANGLDIVDLDIEYDNAEIGPIVEDWQAALKRLPDDASLNDWINVVKKHVPEYACFGRAAHNWETASSLSLAFTWQYFRRTRHLDRARVLEMDTHVGASFCNVPDFYEGVHAKLIDKNRAPNWVYPHVESVPLDTVLHILES